MSNFGSDKFINRGPTMSIEGVETAGATKIVAIYDNFDGHQETGSINFPAITLNNQCGIVCFIGRVYNKGWQNYRIFQSIPLYTLKQSNSSHVLDLSSQGNDRTRKFYWNGTGITISGGNSIGFSKIVYLY